MRSLRAEPAGTPSVPPGLTSLSPRERDILALIGDGLTNREIGRKLYLPKKTVKNNTPLAHAETAYRSAVRAAAGHAAHRTAAGLLAAEAERTRQRSRAVHRHWILRLQRELAAVEPALEEAEHEEAVRRRWAASQGVR
jgi:DNA-binding CsgD family transcriptional regulator